MRDSGNVVAELRGAMRRRPGAVVGGHLDSWDHGTGSDRRWRWHRDHDRSGQADMDSGQLSRTIRIVWFGDKETGGFGEIAYAKANESVNAMPSAAGIRFRR